VRRSVLLFLIACSKHLERGAFDDIVELKSPPGVSDLSIDDRGTLWAIPERDRFVLEIERPNNHVTAHPLDGVSDGLDTEAIAWLAPGRFALGTEGQHEPTASVLFAELRADSHVVVTGARALTDEELGVSLVANKGVEGMCGRGDDLLVAIETVGELADGTRWAPLARLHGTQLVSVAKLRLTSRTGKISALWCDGDDVWAIERHYSVARLLHFRAGAGELTPKVALDLDPLTHGAINPEGLARLPDGRFVLINDNQGATIDGPTELLVLPRGSVQPRACADCSSRSSSSRRTRPRKSSRSIR